MKRLFFLLAFIGFCQIMAFSQKKYEMVIEKTDGSEIAINVEDIIRTYFRERSEGGNEEQSFLVGEWIECDAYGTLRNDATDYEVMHMQIYPDSKGDWWSITRGKKDKHWYSFDYSYTLEGTGGTMTITITSSSDPVEVGLTETFPFTYENGIFHSGEIYYKKKGDDSGGGTSGYTFCPDENHPHMIDLGLPSGTKWACCNVGAISPEGYGGYYAWGETQPKSVYNWDTYLYGSGWDNIVNIGSEIAGTSYDASTVNWGTSWHMPTEIQWNELRHNTTSEWTTQNGVYGRKFIGSNGGTIFFPAVGYRINSELKDVGSVGRYWLSTYYDMHGMACSLFLKSNDAYREGGSRYIGCGIRPVYTSSGASSLSIIVTTLEATDVSETSATLNGYVAASNTTKSYTAGFFLSTTNSTPSSTDYTKNVTYSGSNPIGYFSASATELLSGTKYYFRAYVLYDGYYYYGVPFEFTTNDSSSSGGSYLTCPDSNHPHMIDLGLPSGTKWACCNVGANAPEEYGNYYAWGETQTKSVYSDDTYQYYQNGKYVDIGTDIAGTDYDAATANWGEPWQMPSEMQLEELCNNCTSVWITLDGVDGRKFTGSNGGSIFLPAAGFRWDELELAGIWSLYWSSTISEHINDAYALASYPNYLEWHYHHGRYGGHSVRPVRKN